MHATCFCIGIFSSEQLVGVPEAYPSSNSPLRYSRPATVRGAPHRQVGRTCWPISVAASHSNDGALPPTSSMTLSKVKRSRGHCRMAGFPCAVNKTHVGGAIGQVSRVRSTELEQKHDHETLVMSVIGGGGKDAFRQAYPRPNSSPSTLCGRCNSHIASH